MIRILLLLAILGLPSFYALDEIDPKSSRPNIIYVLADDLGYGDLGCYGQKIVRTPHLDQMAREGLRFTQHYSGSTVCAPTRACLMTGLHTGHVSCRGNIPGSLQGLDPKDLTIATQLKKGGYKTAMIGKWGLGLEGSATEPNNMGFDFFYGNLSQLVAHSYYPRFVFRNRTPEYFEGNNQRAFEGKRHYVQDRMTGEALSYVKSRAKDGEPFFLYVPYLIPHASIDAPERDYAPYVGEIEEAKPWGRPNQSGYAYQPRPRATFAGMVSRLDADVGKILTHLRKLDLADNTLVLFSSDNGPHLEGGADPDFFDSNGPLRGYKRSMTDGGIRVPLIAWWPGTIQAGGVTDHVSAHWDLFPTFNELAGLRARKGLDGISLVPTLLGQPDRQKQHDHLYWEFSERGGSQAVRMGPWKGIRRNIKAKPNAAIELYHLGNDLGETTDVAKKNPKVIAELKPIFTSSRTRAQHPYQLLPEDYEEVEAKPGSPATDAKVANPITLPDAENRLDISFGGKPVIVDLDDWGPGVTAEAETFKKTPQGDLRLVRFHPKTASKNAPCVVFYYGGGWKSGVVNQFYAQAAHLASLGIVTVCPQYRIENLHGTTPFESVMDARSAYRFVRSKAGEWGIDPDRIATAGGSAGGHVAAACRFLEVDDPADDLSVPVDPVALLLYNPVIDTSEAGYGFDRLRGRWKELSPLHHVGKQNGVPAIVFHGEGDTTVPFEGAAQFAAAMKKAGHRADLHAYPDRNHGFFNATRGREDFVDCWSKSLAFLEDLKMLEKGGTDAVWLSDQLVTKGR